MRTQEDGTFPERHVSDLNIFVLQGRRRAFSRARSIQLLPFRSSLTLLQIQRNNGGALYLSAAERYSCLGWAVHAIESKHRPTPTPRSSCCRLVNLVAFLVGCCLVSRRGSSPRPLSNQAPFASQSVQGIGKIDSVLWGKKERKKLNWNCPCGPLTSSMARDGFLSSSSSSSKPGHPHSTLTTNEDH